MQCSMTFFNNYLQVIHVITIGFEGNEMVMIFIVNRPEGLFIGLREVEGIDIVA